MSAEVDPEAGNNPKKSRAAQVAPARTLTLLQALATLFAMAVLLIWGFGVGGADASGSSWTVRAGSPPVQAASPVPHDDKSTQSVLGTWETSGAERWDLSLIHISEPTRPY